MTVATITEGSNGSGTIYTGVSDTRAPQSVPTTNYSASSYVAASSYGASDYARSFLQFTGLSNITGPVTVSSASLFIYCSDASNAVNDFDLHRVKVANNISQLTWNEASTGVAWATAGAYDSTDIDMTAAASVSNVAINTWVEFAGAGLAALVEGWINGTFSNYGAMLKRNAETADATFNEFSSSEAPAAYRPYLVVTYTAGGGVPTVSSVSSPSATEGSAGVHTITLSAATTATTNFAASLAGVTATGGGTDFTSNLASATYSNGVTYSGGNFVVPSGVSSFTVSIPTTADTLDEANETWTLTVQGVTGTGTITDDDPLPGYTISDGVQIGGIIRHTVTLDAPSGRTVTLRLDTADGSKTAGTHYTALVNVTVTFAPGETSKDVDVTVL